MFISSDNTLHVNLASTVPPFLIPPRYCMCRPPAACWLFTVSARRLHAARAQVPCPVVSVAGLQRAAQDAGRRRELLSSAVLRLISVFEADSHALLAAAALPQQACALLPPPASASPLAPSTDDVPMDMNDVYAVHDQSSDAALPQLPLPPLPPAAAGAAAAADSPAGSMLAPSRSGKVGRPPQLWSLACAKTQRARVQRVLELMAHLDGGTGGILRALWSTCHVGEASVSDAAVRIQALAAIVAREWEASFLGLQGRKALLARMRLAQIARATLPPTARTSEVLMFLAGCAHTRRAGCACAARCEGGQRHSRTAYATAVRHLSSQPEPEARTLRKRLKRVGGAVEEGGGDGEGEGDDDSDSDFEDPRADKVAEVCDETCISDDDDDDDDLEGYEKDDNDWGGAHEDGDSAEHRANGAGGGGSEAVGLTLPPLSAALLVPRRAPIVRKPPERTDRALGFWSTLAQVHATNPDKRVVVSSALQSMFSCIIRSIDFGDVLISPMLCNHPCTHLRV